MDEVPPQVPGYRLTRLLGRGSTAAVWRARRSADDELVAVKVVPGAADEEAVREYTLLQHAAAEHVVALHETLDIDTDEGPATALVLEHLAGGSLGRVVAERGHLSSGETVTVVAPIAQALSGLHDLGVVHGDLSPGNVLLDSSGRPVLADLGCSRLTGERPGDVHGTDGFVAPEVLEGEEPTRESDVHALGALAWLCLVGSAPGHVAERLDLRDVLPDEAVLADLVESCLASDPARRPEAHDVARAVFDAVPAQPLRMTSSGDIASSLTRRIREAAAEDDVHTPAWQEDLVRARPPEVARRWWHGRERPQPTSRTKGGRHAAPRRRVDGPIDLTVDVDEPSVDDSGPRAIARSAAAGAPRSRRVGVVVAVALGLLFAVLVPWRQLASAEHDEARPAAAQGSEDSVARGEGPPADDASGGVQTDRSAVRRSPTVLAQELTTLRRQVVVDLDTDALGRLDQPGSPAATRDAELIDGLRDSGDRYRGVTMTVRSAHLQRTTGTRAVLRTIVDESAYEVVATDGARTTRPARRGQRVDLVLVWHESAWRVRDVLAIAPS